MSKPIQVLVYDGSTLVDIIESDPRTAWMVAIRCVKQYNYRASQGVHPLDGWINGYGVFYQRGTFRAVEG